MKSMPIAVLLAGAVLVGRADSAPPATDRYGHMHMKYERTFLGVDVASIDVTFDHATRERIAALAAGQQYSDQLAERMARAALEAQTVSVQVQFLRSVSLKEFLDAAHKNLERARNAGYISQSTFATAWANLQRDSAVLAKRGFKKGDRLLYHATPGSLRTTVVAGDRVLLEVTSPGEAPRRAMIASYFAPRTDFRAGLIKNVFRG
jgi:hypothetical protein